MNGKSGGPRRLGRAAVIGLGLAGAAAGSGLGGCASQNAYDRVERENTALRSRNAELSNELEGLRRQSDLFRSQGSETASSLDQLRSRNDELRRELENAMRDLSSLRSRLDSVEFAELDPETDVALERLAAQYPGLVEYDSQRGMLRFASDLTFDSGSAVVKDGAKRSLAALAQILRAPAATQYDVRIVGHTDSQRVSSSTAQRHPTNVHLSAHRAISVRDELVRLDVSAGRLEIAGWGEFRPAVPNSRSGGTPANRRVELFVVPAAVNGGRSAVPPPASAPARAPSGREATVDREQLRGESFDPTK